MTLKNAIVLDVTPYSQTGVYRRFGRMCCHHLQSTTVRRVTLCHKQRSSVFLPYISEFLQISRHLFQENSIYQLDIYSLQRRTHLFTPIQTTKKHETCLLERDVCACVCHIILKSGKDERGLISSLFLISLRTLNLF